MRRPARSLWGVVVPVSLLVLSACDLDRPTSPEVATAPTEPTRPAYASGTGHSGQAQIPLPENNRVNHGTVDWTATSIVIPESGKYRIRVQGLVTVSTSADWLTKPCPDGQDAPKSYLGSYGPRGLPGWLGVEVGVQSSRGFYRIPLDAADEASTEAVATLPAGATMWVRRLGLPGGGQCIVSHGPPVVYSFHHMFDFGGTQTITVEPDGKGKLVLECNGARGSVSVKRGSTIDCMAKTEPEGAPLEVRKWTFEGEGSTIQGPAGSTTWGGPMVVGGSITVEATVDGKSQDASLAVEIEARDWSSEPVPFDVVDENPNALPLRPTKPIELGQFEPQPVFLDWQQAIKKLSSGPNKGYVFFTSIPFATRGVVRVNRPALTEGSEFWRLQPVKARPPRCSRADVEPFVGPALAHEGVPLNSRSHAGLFKETLDKQGGGQFESIVRYEDAEAAYLAAHEVFASLFKAAAANDDKADTLYPVSYCHFRYF